MDGEALDSWIERLARRCHLPMRHLLPAFGEPVAVIGRSRTLLTLPAAVLRRIERQTGLPPGRLDPAVFGPHTPPTWRPITGSRYCPACLSENDMWPLAWRLRWTFACTAHRGILVERCIGCGLPPRQHITFAAAQHPPGRCTNRLVGRFCHTDLTAAPSHELASNDPRLHTQHWINQRLQTAPGGQFVGQDADELADLEAVGAWIRYRARPDDFTGYDAATLAAFGDYLARRHRRIRQPVADHMTDPLIVAAVAVRTMHLLRANTDSQIVTQLRPLLGRDDHADRDARGHRRSVPVNPYWLRTITPSRQARFLSAVDPLLTPLDRLRYRTCTPRPHAPSVEATSPNRIRSLPQLLWADWAARLTPSVGRFSDHLREAAPCWILIAGRARRHTRGIVTGLRQRWHPQAHNLLASLPKPVQANLIAVLCVLADYLDQHTSPIDYQRRRELIGTDLLTWPQWQHLCFATMAHPGQQRRHLDARRYVYQTLTGADLGEPHHDLTFRSPDDRSIYLAFTDRLTTPLRAALHTHAAAHLRGLRIEEPLLWSPPGDIVHGMPLPGRDPADIDLTAAHHLVVDQNTPLSITAEHLGVSLEHVRYAVHTMLHRPLRKWGPNAAPRAFATQQRARTLLTPEFFQREYVTGGKRLKQLHVETGFHRKTLADYAKHAGVTLAAAREPHPIHEAWLRTQYLSRRRSFPAIAAELGISEMTISRAAQNFGIPARPPGLASHPDLVAQLDDQYPPDIRSAVNGQLRGWQRLRRFQQVVQYPSLNIAARHIGANPTALTTQIQRLEHDIGATLINRATPSRPMTPTPRGARLLRDLQHPDIQALLDKYGQPPRGWRPDDPRRQPAVRAKTRRQPRFQPPRHGARRRNSPAPDRPQPHDLPNDMSRDVRKATAGRSGWCRLNRFVTAMTYPTLTEAASGLDIDLATLIGQLQRLEQDIGAPLFHRATPASEPQRPTRRGTQLLQSLRRPDIQAVLNKNTGHPTPPASRRDLRRTPERFPRDLLRAINGQTSGWTRVERFATTMACNSITEAAATIGINRTTLIEQLHRLESDLGTALFHRATAEGQPHRPTRRGTALLQALARPDIQPLRTTRARLPRVCARTS